MCIKPIEGLRTRHQHAFPIMYGNGGSNSV